MIQVGSCLLCRDVKIDKLNIFAAGCSNRTIGCWCMLVGVLIVIVFCILVGLMRIQHDVVISNATLHHQ